MVGNDGLTWEERRVLAEMYRGTGANPKLTPLETEAIERWKEATK